MPKNSITIKPGITVVHGDDYVLGEFLQVYDSRTKQKIEEGLVFDIDHLFGICINLLGLDINRKPSNEEIVSACDAFLNSETYIKLPNLDNNFI